MLHLIALLRCPKIFPRTNLYLGCGDHLSFLFGRPVFFLPEPPVQSRVEEVITHFLYCSEGRHKWDLAEVRQILSLPSSWVSPGPAALPPMLSICLVCAFSFWFSLSTYPAFPMITTCPISSSSAAFLAYLFTQVSSPYWKDMDNMEAGCAICTGSAGEVGHEPDVWRDTCPAGCSSWCLVPGQGAALYDAFKVPLCHFLLWSQQVWVDLPCELCSALCATGLRETGLYWHCSDLDPWGWRLLPSIFIRYMAF